MAKGDAGAEKERKNFHNWYTPNYAYALNDDMISPQRHTLWQNYMSALPAAQADYGDIMGRYRNFSDTGGLSDTEAGDIRSRSVSPIRGMYQRGLSELNRNKRLSGGYNPGFAAQRRAFMRDQSSSMADTMTNANASIAQMRQQGRFQGLAGMAGMYGATPGLARMFGDQAIASTGQALDLGRLNALIMDSLNNKKGIDWAKWAQIAGSIGLGAAALSDKNLKTDIKPYDSKNAISKFKKLPIYNWKYRGNKTEHTGPMAQDFKKVFGRGDGHSIHLVDVMGETLALGKALAEKS